MKNIIITEGQYKALMGEGEFDNLIPQIEEFIFSGIEANVRMGLNMIKDYEIDYDWGAIEALYNATVLRELKGEATPDLLVQLLTRKDFGVKRGGTIPDALFRLKHLTSLYLARTKINGPLDNRILTLSNLEEIDAENAGVTSIPEGISKLGRLKKLNLSRNKLSKIPESIGQLTNLEFLKFDDNNLTSVPDSIGNLKKVYSLNLSYNKLSRIPDTIGKMTDLDWLSIAYNPLGSIPNSLANLKKMNAFYVENTNLPNSEKQKAIKMFGAKHVKVE